MYIGGFSFVDDPKYCDTFYQCIKDSEPIPKQCPSGTFWDGNICNFISQVQCPKAQCNAILENAKYPSGRCCNKYFECLNGKLQEKACRFDEYFDENIRSCRSTLNTVAVCENTGRFRCEVPGVIGDKDFSNPCPGYAVDPTGNPCSYTFNGENITTPMGSIWDQSKCTLDRDDADVCGLKFPDRDLDPALKCSANFLADFNGGSTAVYSPRAGTNFKVYSLQREVQLTGDALLYTSAMRDPYFYYYHYNNKDLNVNTGFRVLFNLQNPQIGLTYDILSNNFCLLCPETIKFTVTLTSVGEQVVSVFFQTALGTTVQTNAVIRKQNSNTLLELIVIYGDDSVYGVVRELTPISYTRLQTVNLTRVNKASGAHIAMNKCGIQLGRGPNYHFLGVIDEFAVYERCQSIDQILS
uniref:Chitin-binding type-2 domain-containing protein n=1 Tax=Biomphalaria glabrata TaxID=6526 RepID=A0A2C9KIN8_BIOGL